MYRRVDNATFGCAQYLVLAMLLILGYYALKVVWYFLTLVFGLVVGGYNLLTSGSSAVAGDVEAVAGGAGGLAGMSRGKLASVFFNPKQVCLWVCLRGSGVH